ncbi:MAG TPA: winged helix-turn-helix domain-containing protein [Vicinamibacterales bacterium]|nr:winged helix-turn-helix domain-containing protein [Vicinamibacterales bacterium]
MPPAPELYRFGSYELHPASGELRQHGDPVKLAPQPAKVLALLVRRAGEVVTRDQFREHVWAGDTFVDFEQGLNFCIRQIRETLGDTADFPHYIETLPRRGYRFVMPVTTQAAGARPGGLTRLIVLPFRMLRPDEETAFLAFSLPDALTASLSCLESIVVRSSLAAARFAECEVADLRRVAAEADVDMIVTGTLLRAGDQVRVTSQLTDASNGTLVWSDSAQVPVGDVFHVQDELTRRVIASLKLPLSAGERQRLQREAPADARAYDYYLRGNQLGQDSRQWVVARELYEHCLEIDPGYAPAWARLGRIHHVMGKYLDTGTAEHLRRAEAAFARALAIDPDLPLTHKLLAQLEVDRGRARDALARLIKRAQLPDPEIMAGLVTACRYCGLLDASVAAHARAIALEPKLRTSVVHTWYLQHDYLRVATARPALYPYIVPLALAEIGRKAEGLAALRELEPKTPTRVRHLISAGRLLLEGKTADSAASMLAMDIADPEARFYGSRHLAKLGETDRAIEWLQRAVQGGFFCYPAIAADPWLDPLRKRASFTKLLKRAEREHKEAASLFKGLQGERMLGQK